MTLKKLSTTRWSSHTRAVDSIYQNIKSIVESLEKIISGEITLNARQIAEAKGLLNFI